VEAVLENGEIAKFGKEDDRTKMPNTPTGLISIGRNI
jgi:hypothetical protein